MQKNIKKNKGVKDWPWWKLFTTVRPLVEVQLSEEQIRSKDEEIQQLRSKLEKVEKERNELRLSSDRLETRISELTSELTDERNTGESASQLLDAETAERLRAEKEMKELQVRAGWGEDSHASGCHTLAPNSSTPEQVVSLPLAQHPPLSWVMSM